MNRSSSKSGTGKLLSTHQFHSTKQVAVKEAAEDPPKSGKVSFSLPLSSGATRRGPFSMTLMDISSRSGRCGKLRLEANEQMYV